DADVDQGDAVAVGGLQVVGRHLVLVPDHTVEHRLHLTLGHAPLDHHVTGQHQTAEARLAQQHVQPVADELVHIPVVVGQQYPRLDMAPVGTGVMHQPAQGEV